MEKESLALPSVVKQTWVEEAIIGGVNPSLASKITALEVNQEHFRHELEKADERIRNIEVNSQKIEIVGKICEAIATPAIMKFLVAIAVFLLFPKAEPLIREVIQETQPLPKQELKDGVLSS